MRRDEAEARAREEAQEKRMQEIDSARRLAILRGEVPPPLEDAEPSPPSQRGDSGRGGDRDGYSGRKRKRRGEDDTDFEMRLARERVAAGDRAARELAAPTSLVDSKGHLTLFEPPPEPSTRGGSGGKDDEAARRGLEDKDQYQMRFVNAAGRDGQGLTDGGPWYASREGASSTTPVPRKNVFGQEDPGRKEREAARLDASDPLALMKQGAKMVRELEKERRREREERERELSELEKEERRLERKRRKREEERHREKYDEKERRRRRSRERRHDGSDGDSDSARRERSHRHRDDEHGERDQHRSRERERNSRHEKDRSDRRRDSHQDYRDRHRDGSRERRRRPEGEDGRERQHHRDDDRARRSRRQEEHERDTGKYKAELR